MQKHLLSESSQPFGEYEASKNRAQKKKRILYGLLIFLIIAIITILCVVFLVILKNENSSQRDSYRLKSFISNDTHFLAFLEFTGTKEFYADNVYSPYIKNITLIVSYDSKNELSLKIVNSNSSRFEIPNKVPFPQNKEVFSKNKNYRFENTSDGDHYSFKIIRNDNNLSIFDTADLNLVYSDRYLEFNSKLLGNKTFGLSDESDNYFLEPGLYTVRKSIQPVILIQDNNLTSNLILFKNSNPTDVIISEDYKTIKYITIGGIIDFKIFIGDERIENVIKSYHNYLNHYEIFPFWSLGYQFGAYGVSNDIVNIANLFDSNRLPLETIYIDEDYMQNNRTFTINTNFNLTQINELNTKGLHLIPRIKPGIYFDNSSNSSLLPFIISSVTTKPLLNKDDSGFVNFIDFNHPNASEFWSSKLNETYQIIKFDGIWLDGFDPEGQIDGEANLNANNNDVKSLYSQKISRIVQDDIDHHYIYSKNLPYIPGKYLLENSTISVNATHFYNGIFISSDNSIPEIDFHNLNGFTGAYTSSKILREKLNFSLPFVISNNDIFGSGSFSAKIIKQNNGSWEDLQTLIPKVLKQQMYGNPNIGIDLCGEGDEELCGRYYQTSILFPIVRSYNKTSSMFTRQAPFTWGIDNKLIQGIKEISSLRYSLLKWYYGLFIRNNGTGTILKPMLFNYPTSDSNLFKLDSQYLVGDDLIVAPVLENNTDIKEVFIPPRLNWFDFNDGTKVYNKPSGDFVDFTSPYYSIPPMLIKEGSILALQDSGEAFQTKNLNNEFSLKIVLSNDNNSTIYRAQGNILGIQDYNNDKNILENCTGTKNCVLNISATAILINDTLNISISFTPQDKNFIIQDNYVVLLDIYGVKLNEKYVVFRFNMTNKKYLISSKSNLTQNIKYTDYYILQNIDFGANKISANLIYKGPYTFYKDNKISPISKNLSLEITLDTNTELTIKLTDVNIKRFTLPYKYPFPYTKSQTISNKEYEVILSNQDQKFSIVVRRTKTQEAIFDSSNSTLIFSRYYMEFGTSLSNPFLFGLGERRQDFLFKDGIYTIFPKDQLSKIDNGTGPDNQTYGTFPMYMLREKSNNFHIVFLRSSHPMDVEISQNVSNLCYKVVEGILEFKIFLGSDPQSTIKQFHDYINGYSLFPFWSLGYHQSRWGYLTSQMMLEVVDKFNQTDIPLDTIWSDIDYMANYEDFKVNETFLKSDFDKIRAYGVKWVPIVDIGIAAGENFDNSVYQDGVARNIFIKSSKTNTDLINCVWPKKVSYPDFNHPNTSDFWTKNLKNLYMSIPYDGLWLDMNEPSAFVDGEINKDDQCGLIPLPVDPSKPITNEESNILTNDKYEGSSLWSLNLPYRPGLKPLETKTISMDAYHVGKGFLLDEEDNISELTFHGLHGFFQSKITYDFMKDQLNQSLPFILSRNTLFSQGLFSSHWTGDNNSSWPFLQTAISEIFNFNLFGIPHVGTDLCGFDYNTTEELCARSMQAGAFFPFSRNHNQIYRLLQEPYAWGADSVVYKASRNSLKTRYSILKWYYSLFVRGDGRGSIFNPLFFSFPNEELYSVHDQFLLGEELMVAPCVNEGETERNIIFPNEIFYGYFEGINSYKNQTVVIKCPLDSNPPIFIRENSIISIQNSSLVKNVNDLNNVFQLKIAFKRLNNNYSAKGYMMGIDSYSSDIVKNNCLDGKDCILKLDANIFNNNEGKLKLEVIITKRSANFSIQTNFIEKLEIFYTDNEGKVVHSIIDLGGRIQITEGKIIDLNL